MFINLLITDLKRSLDMRKVIPAILLIVFFMIFGENAFIDNPEILLPWSGYSKDYNGILEYLGNMLLFDKFKVIFVILLCSLYSSSYCKDKSNGYILMVLNRTDATSYTQSKFIANTISIIFVSLCSFFLYVFILFPHIDLVSPYCNNGYYYLDIMLSHPVCYIIMAALQFSMIAAACGSIGLLVSIFQPDAFVSIGLPGLIFFLALSFKADNGPFDILSMVGMNPTLTLYTGGTVWLDYLWGITFPFMVICLTGFLFYLRLTKKIIEGNI